MLDDNLLQALADGDPGAGFILVSQLGPGLMAYARAIGPELGDTDRELLCERALERAISRIDAFDATRGTFAGWVRGFLRIEVASFRRARPLLGELTDDIAQRVAEVPSAPIDERAIERLGELMRELKHEDQLIIRLRDIEQLPYADIADRLDTREEACRQRHLRALRRLASRLREDAELSHLILARQ